MKGYTSEAKINEFLQVTIPTGKANSAMETAEKMIDNITGRSFIAIATANERYYNGNGLQTLSIDDCVEVTKVEIANDYYGTTFNDIASGNYILEPRGYASLGQCIKRLTVKNIVFPYGNGNVKVTAKWGYSTACPADISQVATIIASFLYKYGASGSIGGLKSESIGEYSVSYKDTSELSNLLMVNDILSLYKKYYF